MSKHVYIIGNGFDIHHGFQSRFRDYKNWLLSHRSEVFEAINRVYEPDDDCWWGDFEQSLSKVDIPKNAQRIAEEHRPQFISDDFGDVEYHMPEIGADNEFSVLRREIAESLAEWIRSLPIPRHSDLLPIHRDCSGFVSFNYTMTLEDLYHISPRNILHIHGSILEGDLVFGHGVSENEIIREPDRCQDPPDNLNSPEELETWYTGQYDHFYEIAKAPCIKHVVSMRKDTSTIMEHYQMLLTEIFDDSEFIHVYDLSLSEVGIPYITFFAHMAPMAKWELSYYGLEEQCRMSKTLDKLSFDMDRVKFVSLKSLQPDTQLMFDFDEASDKEANAESTTLYQCPSKQ